MSIVLPALGVGFAAFCVWLGVRIFNRRERWAKWTAVALAGLLVFYPMSIGPVCWGSSHAGIGSGVVSAIYGPLIKYAPSVASRFLEDYSGVGAATSWSWRHIVILPTAETDVEGLEIRIVWESD
jgi:hypothetical protein